MILTGVLQCRLRLLIDPLRPGARGTKSTAHRPLLALTLALGLGTFVMLALMALFLHLQDSGADPTDAAIALALVLGATLVGLLAFDLHEVVSTLVMDSDLELLRRAPVRPGAIFALKLADAFPRTSVLLVILGLPALAAYAAIHPMAPWGWALLAPALVALWAIALGAGVAVAMLLLRVVPARTAREVLGLISTIAVLVLWLSNSFLMPHLVMSEGSALETLRAVRDASPLVLRWSPGTWVAQMMSAAAAWDLPAALHALGATFAMAAAVLLVAGTIAGRNLEAVQARILGAGSRRTRVHARPVSFAARPRLLTAFLARDLRLFLRDWTVLGDMLVASLLWTLLPLVGMPLYELESVFLANAMLLALTVALGYEVATRAIPFERDGLAWMRLAPVPASRWIMGRALSTLLIALPIVLIAGLAVVVALGLDARQTAAAASIVGPALAIALGVGLWTGAAHGNPQWTQPHGMLTLTGRALATLLLVLQAGGWLAWSVWAASTPSVLVTLLPVALAVVLVPLLVAATAREFRKRSWG